MALALTIAVNRTKDSIRSRKKNHHHTEVVATASEMIARVAKIL